MIDRSRPTIGLSDRHIPDKTKILLGIVAGTVIIIAIAAILTFTMSVTTTTTGVDLPFVTHYAVSLPDGDTVTIGSSRVAAMAYNGTVITDADGNREQLVTGQTRIIKPRHATISIFGVQIYSADFQITLQYLGSTGSKDNFDLIVASSEKLPSFILDRLLPPSVSARKV